MVNLFFIAHVPLWLDNSCRLLPNKLHVDVILYNLFVIVWVKLRSLYQSKGNNSAGACDLDALLEKCSFVMMFGEGDTRLASM